MNDGPTVPRIVAYRGASWALPPNTFPAFEAAQAEQADAIGVEVRLTRDGVAVACEDRLLRALGTPFSAVREASVAELAPIDVGRGFAVEAGRVSIPRIEEVLVRFGDRPGVFLFLPDGPQDPARLVQALEGACTAARRYPAWIVSAVPETLRRVRAALPDPRLALRVRPGEAGAAEDVADVDGICVSTRGLSGSLVGAARAAGLQLLGFECDSPGAAAHARRFGLEVLVTERPGWLRGRLLGRVAGRIAGLRSRTGA